MTDTLSKICVEKRQHIALSKKQEPLNKIEEKAKAAGNPRGFYQKLKSAADNGIYGLVAEVKKASPSKGLIRKDFNPTQIAAAFKNGGATCLSVLTDVPYFQGKNEHLIRARSTVNLPILRKDFILDPYQIAESRALGADCILLIMAALDNVLASELEASAINDWGMDVLIEIHDTKELDRAMKLRSPLLGINNRNLKTLKTDIETTRRLAPLVKEAERLVVSESGLYTPEDLALMYDAGAKCFLIGESLMRQDDIEKATRRLLNRTNVQQTQI
ncbi:MAG: indole-3-glycerol phosphate synthase TrpC [Pseudomonadota bacterium]|nr:indole-3-glycerol phosphate synthase TrpC [Pseudomonadota bacterium]